MKRPRLLSALAICHLPLILMAQSLQLWFAPSPDTNAVGTYIYATRSASDFADTNAPENYLAKIDAGTNATVTLTNVMAGQYWYFTATAYSAAGAESVHCNVLSVIIPKLPPSRLRAYK